MEHQIYMLTNDVHSYKNLAINILQQKRTRRDTIIDFVKRKKKETEDFIKSMYVEDHVISDAALRDMFKRDIPDNETDKRFALSVCGGCGGTDVQVSTAQLRSADEGMSTIHVCNTCGNRWITR